MNATENSRHTSGSVLYTTSTGQQRLLPKLQPLHQDGRDSRDGRDLRNQLPRGCRFPSLNEAHRNITGRSLSNGELSIRSASSVSSLKKENDESIVLASLPVQSVARPREDHNPFRVAVQTKDQARRLAEEEMHNNSRNTLIDPIDQVIRQISNSPTPGSVAEPAPATSHQQNADGGPLHSARLVSPSERSVSPRRDIDDTVTDSPSSPPAVHLAHLSSDTGYAEDTSNTTVERVYRKYQSSLSFVDQVHHDTLMPRGHSNRDGATTRLGFRLDDTAKVRPLSDSGNLYSASSANLADRDALATDGGRVHSLLASIPTHDSLLYPMPLRVQSMRAEGKYLSGRSGLAVSATGMTTDSDDDPFQYDKDAYKIFLHPSKEREVSAALIHVSGLSSHSKATLFGQDDEPSVTATVQKSPIGPSPAASAVQHVDNHLLLSDCRTRSTTPESNDGFYDTSVIQPNWAPENGAYEVKVVLQDIHPNQTPRENLCLPTRERKTDKNAEKRFPTTAARVTLKGSLYRAKDKENKDGGVLSSERDEWETVATSAPGFGTVGRSFPLGFPLGPALHGRGAKITGSSLADVSDDSSFCRVPFDEYASTDRIVQHPSGQEDSEESLQIRHLSGTRFPVIIPKQRVHRVNGFAQESSRLLTPPQRPGSDAAAGLARKVSNPFRQLSARQQSRPIPPPMLLKPLPHGRDKGRSRFEFRLSQASQASQASDCEALCGREMRALQGDSSDATDGLQGASSNLTTLGEATGESNTQEDSFPRRSNSSRSSGSTVHSFPFPLIPLPEAARLQAGKRTRDEMGGTTGLHYRTAGHHGVRTPAQVHGRNKPRKFLLDGLHTPPSPSKRLGIPKTSTMLSSISSTTAGGTWATIAPFGSTRTRAVAPSRILKTAVAKLHLGDIAQKLKPQAEPQPSFSVGSSMRSMRSGRNTPRLYPWDYSHQQRCWQEQQEQQQSRHRTQGTDPELRAIAVSPGTDDGLSEDGRGRMTLVDTTHDLERMGVPLDPDAFLSREARRQRRLWFLCMTTVSLLFPFIAVLVYIGKLDSGLSWYTRGEVDRLSVQQRRVILGMAVLQCIMWPSIIVAVVWCVQQGR